MRHHLHLHAKQLIVIGIILIFFLISSFYAKQVGMDSIEEVMKTNLALGLVVYTLYVIISTVITTLPVVPMWPVAYHLLGYWPSVISTLLGVVTGASIAFLLTRRFGRPFVEKIVHKNLLQELDHVINGKTAHSFVILRAFGNNYFDILSYAAGLSKMSFKKYITVTTITSIFWIFVIFFVIAKASSFALESALSIMGVAYGIMGIIGFIVWNKLARSRQ